jgi:polyribonucleotide nucleotidyltransferase
MDAGVPISAHVAGISTGMVSTSDQDFVLLTDIAGIEDHFGDMDFKITGTRKGITAIQLDIKRAGLTLEMIKQTLARSQTARFEILDLMEKTLASPRPTLAAHAPKISILELPQDKIGEVIGSGGKTIKMLMERYGVQIDINDQGQAFISGLDTSMVETCVEAIKAMIKEPQIGEVYDGEVMRVESYGAFVEFLPGQEALLHISEMATGFVKDVSSIIKVGDKLKVTIAGFNDNHQIKLSAPEFKAAHIGQPNTSPAPMRTERKFAGERHSGFTPKFDNFHPPASAPRRQAPNRASFTNSKTKQ